MANYRERLQAQLDDPRKKSKWQRGFYMGIASTVSMPIALFGLLYSGRFLVKEGTWSMSEYVQRAVPLLVFGGAIFLINASFGLLSYRQPKRMGEFGARK